MPKSRVRKGAGKGTRGASRSGWAGRQTQNAAGRRAWATRTMMAEDARWFADAVLSAERTMREYALFAFPLTHIGVRIGYEGLRILNSPDPLIGARWLAELHKPVFDALTERIRHQTKLSADTQLGLSGVLDELGEGLTSARPAHLFATHDAEVIQVGDRLVASSVPVRYRLRLDLRRQTFDGVEAGIQAVANEWGSAIGVLAAATLDTTEPEPTLDLSGLQLRQVDVRIARYLGDRYGHALAPKAKLLLNLIEGDLNTVRAILPFTAPGHSSAEFRAAFITTYQALETLNALLRGADMDDHGAKSLCDIMNRPTAQRFRSDSARHLRNQLTHYGIRPHIEPVFRRPCFGLVEILMPGTSFAEIRESVEQIAGEVTDFLHSW